MRHGVSSLVNKFSSGCFAVWHLTEGGPPATPVAVPGVAVVARTIISACSSPFPGRSFVGYAGSCRGGG